MAYLKKNLTGLKQSNQSKNFEMVKKNFDPEKRLNHNICAKDVPSALNEEEDGTVFDTY